MMNRPLFHRVASLITAALLCTTTAVAAQQRRPMTARDDAFPGDEELQQPITPIRLRPANEEAPPLGRIAPSAVGEVGRRQNRQQDFQQIEPLARIDSRVRNRVQSRLRTRIDRNYDPQANATSPFAVAEEQTRSIGRRR